MFSKCLNSSKCLLTCACRTLDVQAIRWYADDKCCKRDPSACVRAIVDIPEETPCPPPPVCKKPGILHKIKLKITEGGTNFGTPFRWIDCAVREKLFGAQPDPPEQPEQKLPALPEPEPCECDMSPYYCEGVQVAILGADTRVGQFVALLLKQCPQIKKLRLYEAYSQGPGSRDLCQVLMDLQKINTNCLIQVFNCSDFGLNYCLQNSDIVLMLENACVCASMPVPERFEFQAPIVKRYADAIAHECPKAFIIVCASPIDCMVPLIAETMKETGWYDPKKLMGSLALPEMRASTLAARALSLEPHITRVPCVGGTEGDTLVPLFSQAVGFFDFTRQSSEMLTETVRNAPLRVSRCEGPCLRAADLSEAYALSGLVANVANALLCYDMPQVSGFVETDSSQVISPARYLSVDVLLSGNGVYKQIVLPPMNDFEKEAMGLSFYYLQRHVRLAETWHSMVEYDEIVAAQERCVKSFQVPAYYERLGECTHHLTD